MSICPRCNCETIEQNRLLLDRKCRKCFLSDTEDCAEYKMTTGTPIAVAPWQTHLNVHPTNNYDHVATTTEGYICTVCKRSFRSRKQRYFHRACGDLITQFSCTHCNRRFADSISLQNHLQSHDINLKYCCTLCGIAFERGEVLERHMQDHKQSSTSGQHRQNALHTPTASTPHVMVRNSLSFGGGQPIDLFSGLRFGNLIIYLAGGRSCLSNSCSMSKVKYDERQSLKQPFDGTFKSADIVVNNVVIATATGENVKSAKLSAYRSALLLLQAHCYSIKLNATRETIKVEKNKQGVNINVTQQSADLDSHKLNVNSKGYRMMRLMGWTGGGLGRLKQGIDQPVNYLFKANRLGLGSDNSHDNLEEYRQLIENYVNSDDMRDLQFEPSFSKEERVAFHRLALKFGLRSYTHTTGYACRVLISKKVGYETILKEVLIHRNPKFCDRYFVQVPMQKANLFPGHVAPLDLEDLE